MARNKNDTVEIADFPDAPAPVKTVGKFKFNTRQKSRPPLQTNTDENCSLNTNNSKTVCNDSNASDCVILSDDECGFATVKSIVEKEKNDDIFMDYKASDLTVSKASTVTKRDVLSMDDLYAKYGSPQTKAKATPSSFDIDKELKSNASYVNTIKKLDEDVERLIASPKKPTTGSKFKFNTRSKPAVANGPNTTQISGSSNSNFKTNNSSSSLILNKNVEQNASVSKTSTITSGSSSNSSNTNKTSTNPPTHDFRSPTEVFRPSPRESQPIVHATPNGDTLEAVDISP